MDVAFETCLCFRECSRTQLGERREVVVREVRALDHTHEAGQYSHDDDNLWILVPTNGRMAVQPRRLSFKG